jgi:hypothetical protein
MPILCPEKKDSRTAATFADIMLSFVRIWGAGQEPTRLSHQPLKTNPSSVKRDQKHPHNQRHNGASQAAPWQVTDNPTLAGCQHDRQAARWKTYHCEFERVVHGYDVFL